MIGRRTAYTAGPSTDAREQPSVAFAALRHPDYRLFFIALMLMMMGDNVEHVISYWMLDRAFHSPVMGGFAVISHWTPALLFAVLFGTLADHYDCRKIIQVSQGLFILASLGWGVLFLTGTLEVWHAVVLLIMHGMAGALSSPAVQLIVHDIVGPQHLQSAIRLSSTGRQLGLLAGPAVGGAALLFLDPGVGMLVNVVAYLPLTIWLWRVPYTGHRRAEEGAGSAASTPPSRRGLGLRQAPKVLRELSGNRTILAMVVLTGFSSLLVGNAYQAQMPAYAQALVADERGVAYSALFGANALGAVAGGLLLEGGRLLQPNPHTAVLLALVWCASIIGFAAAQSFVLGFTLLVLAGISQLAFTSMAQTLVQLMAPLNLRGRAVGLLNMAQQGLRVGSGVSVGVLGSIVGIHWSLGLSAGLLLGITLLLLGQVTRDQRKAAAGA
jgi:MFS family permease